MSSDVATYSVTRVRYAVTENELKGGFMEPLVLFGAGLVVYCGYLAFMDEVADMKRSFAKNGVKCRRKDTGKGNRSARNVPDCSAGYAGNRGYGCSRLLAPQVH
jgi:hypothetical protein